MSKKLSIQEKAMNITICIDQSGEDTDDFSSSRYSKATQLHGNHALNFQFLRQGKLFGRSQHIESLKNALHRRLRPDSTPELILITGVSGAGKTVLARKLKQPIQEEGGFFVMGKFDQLRQSQPFAPLVAAMTELVRQVLSMPIDVIDSLSSDIRSQVGTDIGVLTMLIPALEELVEKPEEGSLFTLKSVDAEERLKSIFVKFLKATCSCNRPLVLVLDDLQWAGSGSLEMLEAVISDRDIRGLVVVGTCRSNEVSYGHDLSIILRRLEDEKKASIFRIDVGSLSIQATNELIASALRSAEHDCVQLTDIVFKKTQGNVFCTVEYLKALFADGILKKDPVSRVWQWEDALLSTSFEGSDSIVHLIVERIDKLPAECKTLLVFAACFGTELDEDLLSKIFVDSLTVDNDQQSSLYNLTELVAHVNFERAIDRCASEGIIAKDMHACSYRFSHDLVKEAAYNLMTQTEKPRIHLSLGLFLCQVLKSDELDQYVFVVVDQMNLGRECIGSEFERKKLSSICLLAAQKAIKTNDFKTAFKILELATSLLNLRQSWRDDYDQTLQFHNTIAQASCYLGNFDRTDSAIDSIKRNARSFPDTIPSLMLQIYSYQIRLRVKDAIDLGLHLLEQLGEPLPKKRGSRHIAMELFKINRILKKRKYASIDGLPDMNDPMKLVVMGVLNVLVSPCLVAMPNLFPWVVFKLLHLTLKDGASAISSMAFAGTGIVMANFGDTDTAYRLGQLALQFLGRYKGVRNDWVPRVYVLHYGLIALSREPVGLVLEKLAVAQQVGLDFGDVEMCFFGLHMCTTYTFYTGYSLIDMEQKMKVALEHMAAQNQKLWHVMTHTCYEALLILMDRASDPAVANGRLMAVESGSEKLPEILQIANLDIEMYHCEAAACRMAIAYHMGDFDLALEMATRSRNARKLLGTSMAVPFQVSYDAYTCLALLRHHNLSPFRRRRLLNQARNCLSYLQKMSNAVPENYLHKIYFIEGEILVYEQKPKQALSMYSMARHQAKEHKFLDVVAMACEREAQIRKELGLVESSSRYQEAIKCYEEWGAFSKANRMKNIATGA